jgi:hypothetical protein
MAILIAFKLLMRNSMYTHCFDAGADQLMTACFDQQRLDRASD